MRFLASLLVLAFPAIALGQVCPSAPADPVPRDAARLQWGAPTTNTDGTSIVGTLTYTVYKRVGTTDTLACTTTSTTAGQVGLAVGTHTWVVTARVGTGPESTKSNAASKTIAAPTPSPPTNLTVDVTLVGSAGWTCNDPTGVNPSSNHTRQDQAQERCTNLAVANVGQPFEMRPGGVYRIVASVR